MKVGNQFLSQIRSVNVIIQVVRFFNDDNITHVESRVDPLDDMEIINTELILADIKTIERSLEKNVKLIKANKPEGRLAEEVLTNLLNHMNNGLPLALLKETQKKTL